MQTNFMYLAIPIVLVCFLYFLGLHQKIKHYEALMDEMEEDFEEATGYSIYKFRDMKNGKESDIEEL